MPGCRRRRLNVALVFFVFNGIFSSGCMLICVVVGFIFVLWCLVVSPYYRRWCNNLNEPLDPFPFLGGC